MKANSSIVGSLHQDSSSGPKSRTGVDLAATSGFLKREIGLIIREELKTYHLRNKMEAELKEHQEKQINQQLSRMVFEDKMTTYRDRQQSSRRKKYEEFLKRKEARQQRLKLFMKDKQQNHQDRFSNINQTIENVREKHQHLTHEDSRSRLRKLGIMTASSSRPDRQGSRALSTSCSSSHRNLLHKLTSEREASLVTNYLTKIQRSESRVLLRDLQNESRVQTSKKSRVKCLIDQRNKQEVQKMVFMERQYKERMDHFQASCAKTQQEKKIILGNRSLINQTNFKKAAERREMLKSKENLEQTQLTATVCSSKGNILNRYKSTLDLVNNRRNMRENLKKMREEASQAQLDSTMKVLTEKLQKIRNLRYGEKLDVGSIKTILSLIDKNDPEFAGLSQFLQSQRRTFLDGLVKREEERSKFDKLKKMNKSPSKTGALM